MTENGKKFLEILSSDTDMMKSCRECKDASDVINLASQKGLKLSEEDLNFGVEDPKYGKLADDDLEAVSGGAVCRCPFVGSGAATKKGQDICECAFFGEGMAITAERKYHNVDSRCFCMLGGHGKDISYL